jgi:hypothetical protein
MHCPNCGTQVTAEQKFCRSCGLQMEAIQQIVARHLSEVKPAGDRAARLAWQMFSGVVLMFAGAGLLALEKRHLLGAPAGLLGLLLTMGGPLLALYAVLSPLLHPRSTRPPTPQAASLPAADTTSKLVGAVEAPSVIEHTTRSLEPVAAPRNKQA